MEKVQQELASLAQHMIERAGQEKAEAKVATSASVERRLVIENGEFTLANTLESQSIGCVVHKDQKKGSASTNITSPAEVDRALSHALSLASFSVEDAALNFVPGEDAPTSKALPFMVDPKLAAMNLTGIKDLMSQFLAALTRDPRICLDRFEMSVGVSHHRLMNSLGVNQAEDQTMLSWSYLGMARDGEEVSGMDYSGGFSFSASGFMERALSDIDAFVTKLVGQLHPQRSPTYTGPVILSPRAVEEILISNLLYHAMGRSVMDKKSRWDKSIGSRVVSEKFTLSDNPHDHNLQGATAFDGDGIPTRRIALIENGVLKTHLHDCYSARHCGVKPTATSGAPFALHIAPGQQRLSDMVRARKEILFVDRFSGNADPLTGNFSGVAKGSRLIVDGEDRGGVTETMIAGNVFTLANEILAIQDSVENLAGHILAPSILVDGVSVSGA